MNSYDQHLKMNQTSASKKKKIQKKTVMLLNK